MAHIAAVQAADRGISTTAWRKFGKAIESGRLFDLEEAESWELEELPS